MAARIEVLAAAAWVLVWTAFGALAVLGGGPGWAFTGSVTAGVLLALPCLGLALLLAARRTSRRHAGAVLAVVLAGVCLAIALTGVIGELVRGSTAFELLDRAGGAAAAFTVSAVVHGVAGVTGMRRRGHA